MTKKRSSDFFGQQNEPRSGQSWIRHCRLPPSVWCMAKGPGKCQKNSIISEFHSTVHIFVLSYANFRSVVFRVFLGTVVHKRTKGKTRMASLSVGGIRVILQKKSTRKQTTTESDGYYITVVHTDTHHSKAVRNMHITAEISTRSQTRKTIKESSNNAGNNITWRTS